MIKPFFILRFVRQKAVSSLRNLLMHVVALYSAGVLILEHYELHENDNGGNKS